MFSSVIGVAVQPQLTKLWGFLDHYTKKMLAIVAVDLAATGNLLKTPWGGPPPAPDFVPLRFGVWLVAQVKGIWWWGSGGREMLAVFSAGFVPVLAGMLCELYSACGALGFWSRKQGGALALFFFRRRLDWVLQARETNFFMKFQFILYMFCSNTHFLSVF